MMPYMHVLDGSIFLRFQGETHCRTNRELDKVAINEELIKLENYVNTVKNSHSPGTKSKMALSEFLLCWLVFSARSYVDGHSEKKIQQSCRRLLK